jgi:isopentenyl-diphosphate Delta-isomerase
MKEFVILVNEQDQERGKEGKLKAHQEGVLHRAFSIFIFNSYNYMLIHQRAHDKYHSGGLWTNASCSHPRPGEELEAAAHRRLQEELGFDCPLQWKTSFIYQVKFEQGNLFEHEFDHIFFGITDQQPHPNPAEVAAIAWIDREELYKAIEEHPEQYTYWFKIALEKIKPFLNKQQKTF